MFEKQAHVNVLFARSEFNCSTYMVKFFALQKILIEPHTQCYWYCQQIGQGLCVALYNISFTLLMTSHWHHDQRYTQMTTLCITRLTSCFIWCPDCLLGNRGSHASGCVETSLQLSAAQHFPNHNTPSTPQVWSTLGRKQDKDTQESSYSMWWLNH